MVAALQAASRMQRQHAAVGEERRSLRGNVEPWTPNGTSTDHASAIDFWIILRRRTIGRAAAAAVERTTMLKGIRTPAVKSRVTDDARTRACFGLIWVAGEERCLAIDYRFSDKWDPRTRHEKWGRRRVAHVSIWSVCCGLFDSYSRKRHDSI